MFTFNFIFFLFLILLLVVIFVGLKAQDPNFLAQFKAQRQAGQSKRTRPSGPTASKPSSSNQSVVLSPADQLHSQCPTEASPAPQALLPGSTRSLAVFLPLRPPCACSMSRLHSLLLQLACLVAHTLRSSLSCASPQHAKDVTTYFPPLAQTLACHAIVAPDKLMLTRPLQQTTTCISSRTPPNEPQSVPSLFPLACPIKDDG